MHRGNGISHELMRRLAALDGVCDFRFERKVRTCDEAHGRTFRYWDVRIGPHGCDFDPTRSLDIYRPVEAGMSYCCCQGVWLGDAIEGALKWAEHWWGKAGTGA